MPRQTTFDSCVATASTWLEELMVTLALPADDHARGLRALRAGLHAIRDRMPACEVVQLGAQLPTLVRGLYYEGFTLRNDPHRVRGRTAMIAAVRKELGRDSVLDARLVLRAVIQLLTRHVSRGEIDDIIATLPRPIAELWGELACEVTSSAAPAGAAAVTRTGYSL